MSSDDNIRFVIFGNDVNLSRRDIIGAAIASGVVFLFAISTLCFLGRRIALCGCTCYCKLRSSAAGGGNSVSSESESSDSESYVGDGRSNEMELGETNVAPRSGGRFTRHFLKS